MLNPTIEKQSPLMTQYEDQKPNSGNSFSHPIHEDVGGKVTPIRSTDLHPESPEVLRDKVDTWMNNGCWPMEWTLEKWFDFLVTHYNSRGEAFSFVLAGANLGASYFCQLTLAFLTYLSCRIFSFLHHTSINLTRNQDALQLQALTQTLLLFPNGEDVATQSGSMHSPGMISTFEALLWNLSPSK